MATVALASPGRISPRSPRGTPRVLSPFSTFLKANSSVQQIATDAAGYIYILGQVPQSPIPGNGQDVFVARLDPAATKFTYFVYVGGSSIETAGAMAVDAAGSAWITGSTRSSDFPTVPLTRSLATSQNILPFVAKVDVTGSIVYSTLFSNGVAATPQAIVVDPDGDAIVSGTIQGQGFPATAGAYNNSYTVSPPFVSKLDPSGTKLLFSVVGVGGSSLALDSARDIFITGTTSVGGELSGLSYPTTPGAFQTTVTPRYFCGSPTCFISFLAGEQYVTKLSADGSTLIYSTFLTGSRGALNSGMAVDAAGNIWVTGQTASLDYTYTDAGRQPGNARPGTFTTELDPAGSKVLLSVQQGGSSLVRDREGNIVVADSFPAFAPFTSPFEGSIPPVPIPPPPAGDTPPECLPRASNIQSGAYVMRLSSQDGSVLGTQILPGTLIRQIRSAVDSQGNIYLTGLTGMPDTPLTPGILFDAEVAGRTGSGSFLVRTAASPSRIACVADAINATLIGPVAPGQLLTIYGSGIGPSQPAIGFSGVARLPTSLGGVSITFDGIPAPILYASGAQINVQVPFEIKANNSTVMQFSLNGWVIGSRLFAVAPQNPGMFVTSIQSSGVCGNVGFSGFVALALNEDGSVNSCANPAHAGSTLSLFVNGIGVNAHNQDTGGLTGSNPESVASSIGVFHLGYSLQVASFTDQAGAISGVGQVKIFVPETITSLGPLSLTLIMNGVVAAPFNSGNGGAVTTPSPVTVFVNPH
jgi:uncharacterized protein (TIGR03437 family)